MFGRLRTCTKNMVIYSRFTAQEADCSGPIVRIRPEVLHINDPEYLDQVFGTAGKRRDKYKLTTNGLAVPGAAIGTIPHDLHRSRRAPMNPYFSKQSIQRLEPILQRTLKKVLSRLAQNAESGEPIRMQLLYAATTSDISSDYCFGQSSNNLDREDLNAPYFAAFTEGVKIYHQLSILSWIPSLLKLLPLRVAMLLFPIEGVVKEIKVCIVHSLKDVG
jgi:cytochrome P450